MQRKELKGYPTILLSCNGLKYFTIDILNPGLKMGVRDSIRVSGPGHRMSGVRVRVRVR